MSRGPLNIKARIEKQEKKILQLTKDLESAKDEYQKLIEEKEEIKYYGRPTAPIFFSTNYTKNLDLTYRLCFCPLLAIRLKMR